MSRVSKKKLLKILKGEYDPPSMSKDSVLEYLNKKYTQEEWLKEYKRWKKQQEKELAKNKRAHS
tara:strand:+ start:4973 stop:5164 length:192 start_codon:yes stop_codon:yes gene_type:complete